MTNANQAVAQSRAGDRLPETAVERGPEQQCRAVVLGLLAGLLRRAPDRQTLDEVAALAAVEPEQSELTLAMSMLGLAASTCDPESVDDEFHQLFIGLGRGELMPYGSWYQTGFLMERPLSDLRDDLAVMGYQRTEDVHEPEDHVAALCEVMQMLITDEAEIVHQSEFFNTHIADWIERFFQDLSQAQTAVFYRAVGRFGVAVMVLEKRYLSMQV